MQYQRIISVIILFLIELFAIYKTYLNISITAKLLKKGIKTRAQIFDIINSHDYADIQEKQKEKEIKGKTADKEIFQKMNNLLKQNLRTIAPARQTEYYYKFMIKTDSEGKIILWKNGQTKHFKRRHPIGTDITLYYMPDSQDTLITWDIHAIDYNAICMGFLAIVLFIVLTKILFV